MNKLCLAAASIALSAWLIACNESGDSTHDHGDGEHTHADGSTHADHGAGHDGGGDHAGAHDHGEEVELGAFTIGGMSVELAQGHGLSRLARRGTWSSSCPTRTAARRSFAPGSGPPTGHCRWLARATTPRLTMTTTSTRPLPIRSRRARCGGSRSRSQTGRRWWARRRPRCDQARSSMSVRPAGARVDRGVVRWRGAHRAAERPAVRMRQRARRPALPRAGGWARPGVLRGPGRRAVVRLLGRAVSARGGALGQRDPGRPLAGAGFRTLKRCTPRIWPVEFVEKWRSEA